MAVCRMKSWICWTPRLPSFSCTCSSLELKYWITWKGNIYYKTVFSYSVVNSAALTTLFCFSELRSYTLFGPSLVSTEKLILGCRHSSVDSSAPSIMPPRVRLPSTPSMLLSFIVKFVLYLSLLCEKNENKPKRGRVWPILKKQRQNWVSRVVNNYRKSVFRFNWKSR